MNIFVIHDNRRDDAETAICERELQRQGITSYGFWPAVTSGLPTVADCIAASHKNVIREAKEMGLEEVCVMESDVWFPALGSWDYFLSKKPIEYDMYFAGIYGQLEGLRRHHSFQRSFRGPLSLYNTCFFAGMHCYIMHSRYFDIFLETPEGQHIDVAQEGRGYFRVCYPFAALQRPGWSANLKQNNVDYNGEILPADVFGRPSIFQK